MISAYCLDYNTWTCIPRHVEEDFNEMVEMGVDTVCLSFSENDMAYARRTFEILIELAHKAGLRVFLIPSRIAGRFAGAPLMASTWLIQHPQYQVPDDCWLPTACLECNQVSLWIKDFAKTLITEYEIDGLVWDEPKAPVLVSHHPATIAKYGENPTEQDMGNGFCEFFADLTAYCRELNPKLVQTLFCQKTEPEFFTQVVSKTPCIDYFGYDGNLSKQRIFKEPISEVKYRIESVWNRTLSECSAGEKRPSRLWRACTCRVRSTRISSALLTTTWRTTIPAICPYTITRIMPTIRKG